MFKLIVSKYIIYVLMGVFMVMGVISKLIVSSTLRKLMKAAGNMGKSNHPLMRLVRAKFEHVCMISDRVENVGVFVDKYLYDYRVSGIRIHTLQRMELASAGMCLVLGMAGGGLVYYLTDLQSEALSIIGVGTSAALVVTVFHFLTDEVYRLDTVRNYMIDYLENICMRKYGRVRDNDIKNARVRATDVNVEEMRTDEPQITEAMKIEELPTEESLFTKMGSEMTRVEAEVTRTEPEITKAESELTRTESEMTRAESEFTRTESEMTRAESGPTRTEPEITRIESTKMLDKSMTDGRDSGIEKSKNTKRTESRSIHAEEPQKEENREILIRQILEEFMA